MKNKLMLLVAVCLAVAAVGTAGATSQKTGPGDQGRALRGPFCIDNADGVVHAVALGQKCKAGQTAKTGVAVPCQSVTLLKARIWKRTNIDPCVKLRAGLRGARGPAGPAGPAGKDAVSTAGAVGPAGPAGGPGPQGGAGPKGDTGLTGAKGDKGDPGLNGHDGSNGTNGRDGHDGKDGKDGAPGLGDGVIEVCVSQGGSLQMNVHGQPCDNEGHLPIKIVVVG